eukprot:7741831-Pyramimonas_sp.AAC.1
MVNPATDLLPYESDRRGPDEADARSDLSKLLDVHHLPVYIETRCRDPPPRRPRWADPGLHHPPFSGCPRDRTLGALARPAEGPAVASGPRHQ